MGKLLNNNNINVENNNDDSYMGNLLKEAFAELDEYINDSNYFREKYRKTLTNEEVNEINKELKYIENS